MRALLQRVSRASVTVDGQIVGQIGQGLLVLLGVGRDDSEVQVKTLADKIVHLRIFGGAAVPALPIPRLQQWPKLSMNISKMLLPTMGFLSPVAFLVVLCKLTCEMKGR
jgi:D-Tyr-tRNA(Tyr) deacylase